MTTRQAHHDCTPRPGTCRLPEPWMCDVFYVDGSLRDITVADTDDTHWQQVLHHLRGTADQLTWYDGPEGRDIGRDDTGDPFATIEDGYTATLGVRYGHTRFSAHLPVDGIEFSLWPDAIEDGAHVADVLRFLTELGTACDRPAVLTAETVTGHHQLPPLITYDPSTGTTTHL
ncbi:hypothetical protein ACWGCK_34100 [Streptomyces virginiae]